MIEHKKKYHHELTAHDGIGLTSNVSVRTNCQRLLARERPETHSELKKVVSEMFLVGISFLIVFGGKIGFFFLYMSPPAVIGSQTVTQGKVDR